MALHENLYMVEQYDMPDEYYGLWICQQHNICPYTGAHPWCASVNLEHVAFDITDMAFSDKYGEPLPISEFECSQGRAWSGHWIQTLVPYDEEANDGNRF